MVDRVLYESLCLHGKSFAYLLSLKIRLWKKLHVALIFSFVGRVFGVFCLLVLFGFFFGCLWGGFFFVCFCFPFGFGFVYFCRFGVFFLFWGVDVAIDFSSFSVPSGWFLCQRGLAMNIQPFQHSSCFLISLHSLILLDAILLNICSSGKHRWTNHPSLPLYVSKKITHLGHKSFDLFYMFMFRWGYFFSMRMSAYCHSLVNLGQNVSGNFEEPNGWFQCWRCLYLLMCAHSLKIKLFQLLFSQGERQWTENCMNFPVLFS